MDNDNEKLEKEQVEKEVPKKKEKKKKSIIVRIIDILLWILLFGWIAICLYDFYNVSNEKEPKFCIKKETTKYEDGTVDSCLGLGYKVYNYKRDSYKGLEFGPFWSEDRSVKEVGE